MRRCGVRTTLQIDDDVYEVARCLAAAERRSLGEVISRLARLGLSPKDSLRERNGFPIFEVSPHQPPITPDTVTRALEDS